MADELRLCFLRPSDKLPSIETLMHAFIDRACIVHTHPDAILCLTNRDGGERACQEALGDRVAVIPYANAGLDLAAAVAHAVESLPACRGVVVMHHGLITWGGTPKEAYDTTIAIVEASRCALSGRRTNAISTGTGADTKRAYSNYIACAPVIRRLLSPHEGLGDAMAEKVHLTPLISEELLGMLATPEGRRIAVTPPLTPDYLIRTGAVPLLIEAAPFDDIAALDAALTKGVKEYGDSYESYVRKYSSRLPGIDLQSISTTPRVVLLPGLGAVCSGPSIESATVCRDITEQSIFAKRLILETGGTYRGLSEEHLFDMEFRAIQRAKIRDKSTLPLCGSIAIVTGAAGAIGMGICEELLSQGCAVAVTDLPGKPLDDAVAWLKNLECGARSSIEASRVIGIPLDVTDTGSVEAAFNAVTAAFGGIDIVIINAGIAHVSKLAEMNPDSFKKLERVNIDGTLNCLAESGRRFKHQALGGDIVLISTKNVFAPGAGFGAYSATKAAAHQLCRIASLEFAEMGVRVNMVAPDAVFSHGTRKSGLWAEVGPDRMKARGLDEKGLEDYYRSRNLLKAAVTARHVARAVVFFVTRQTPTTGATIPVDGGLPDATPR
jgi:rhamnose utilization protein RhaD (predicted bifunctional aldolase and dehydrogenase)/NAD(P)-dependent dehydrogenase (short-subunit alcohol dehydrogenase family)